MAPLRVLVIGYGFSAKVFHIPFVDQAPDLELYAILQRSPKPESSAPNDYPNLKHYTTPEPAFADQNVDLVIITTPPDTHFDLARWAILGGKHVLCEKPFVPTVAEAEELVLLARQQDVRLCVYQNRRWDSDFLTVKSLFESGELGRVYEFESHFDRYTSAGPRAWKAELGLDSAGGLIYDLGTHLIDQVYHLYGLPETVYATFYNSIQGGITVDDADSFRLQFNYPTGVIAHLGATVQSARSPQLRFSVRGTKGTFTKNGLDPQEDQLKGGMKFGAEGFALQDKSLEGTLCVATDGGSFENKPHPTVTPTTYLPLFNQLASAIRNGSDAEVPVPGSQGVDVLKLVDACIKSARTKSVVAL